VKRAALATALLQYIGYVAASCLLMLGLLKDAITEARYPVPKSVGVTELPTSRMKIVVQFASGMIQARG